MAKVIRTRSTSLHIRSDLPYQGGMTVWALRDFVRALDAAGVSDETRVHCDHSDIRHLIGLSVQEETTEQTPESAERAGSDRD